MRRLFLPLLGSVFFSLAGTAEAGRLVVSFDDPVGDMRGEFPIDVQNMTLSFNQESGDYEITITTTDENRFVGEFRVNVHFFNGDVGSTVSHLSMLSDTFNDYDLRRPRSTLVLTGVNQYLRNWKSGDRIATHSLDGGGLGNPDGTVFSGVR